MEFLIHAPFAFQPSGTPSWGASLFSRRPGVALERHAPATLFVPSGNQTAPFGSRKEPREMPEASQECSRCVARSDTTG